MTNQPSQNTTQNTTRPNILFLHSHNTGRHIEPYGHAVPTPNLRRLATQGVLFRQAFSAAPTCSPSRGSFLTGLTPHHSGLIGLAHRGFGQPTYPQHLSHRLGDAGYHTTQCGIEHTVTNGQSDAHYHGYHQRLAPLPNEGRRAGADAACAFLQQKHDKPFFLSLGLQDTHVPFPEPDPDHCPAQDARYTIPPSGLPDTPIARAFMAGFVASAKRMDDDWGKVLDTLDQTGLTQNTLVFAFSDHGLQFPLHMTNTNDRGLGVYLIVRGPGGFQGGQVFDSMVSLLDLAPTCCDMAGVSPDPCDGTSLLPLVNHQVDKLHDELYGEQTFHASYEPQRSIRTQRYRYVRRYDNRDRPVLPNTDDAAVKGELLKLGWLDKPRDQEMLFDLAFDRDEYHNVINEPSMKHVADDLRNKLDAWMKRTDDPLYPTGKIPPPAGTKLNHPDDPSYVVKPHITGDKDV